MILDFRLSNTGLGDVSARVIVYALRGNKNLTSLNLSHNSIGDAGGKSLAIMLCRNRHLRHLDVSTNQICDDAASEFADLLELNPSEPEKISPASPCVEL